MPRRPRHLVGLVIATALLLAATGCSGDDKPDRVLLVGDSVMNQAAVPLRQLFGDDVDVRNEAVFGSGLLTPWLFDWKAHLRRLMRVYEPDVVVILFVGNYRLGTADRYVTDDGTVIEDRAQPEFYDAWAHESDALMRIIDDRANVVWVLPPPMRAPDDQQRIDRLRDIYRGLADDWPNISYVDAYDVLAGPNGEYLAQYRNPDGVHLAPSGARRLAEAIHDQVVAAL